MTLDPSRQHSLEEIADLERIAKSIPEIPSDFKDLRELLSTIRKPVAPTMQSAREGELPENFGGLDPGLSLTSKEGANSLAGASLFGQAAQIFRGTVFPTLKSVGDLFYRTDRNILYHWNGTWWLSATEYREAVGARLPTWFNLWDVLVTGLFITYDNNAAMSNVNYYRWDLEVDNSTYTGASVNNASTNVGNQGSYVYGLSVVVGWHVWLQYTRYAIGAPDICDLYGFSLTYRLIG